MDHHNPLKPSSFGEVPAEERDLESSAKGAHGFHGTALKFGAL